MPAFTGSFQVIELSGNPQTTANPSVLGVGAADIYDAGDGTWNVDVSTTEMEEGLSGPFSGSTSTYTINGIAYNNASEIDTGSIFIDNIQVQGYYVQLNEFDSAGNILNTGYFFFPLNGEDTGFVNPGTSTVTSTGQNDTHTPMVYADLAPALVVCFSAGTHIQTSKGQVKIEELSVGQKVKTLDHGMQKIAWIGKRKVPAKGSLAPIVIQKGALGNIRDLRVSPQHRMVIANWKASLLFGEDQVLIAAKHLVNNDTIYIQDGGQIEYYHIMFDQHEVIFAEGIPSESFHPGEMAMGSIDPDARTELLTLFPELNKSTQQYGPAARMSLRSYEAALLAS